MPNDSLLAELLKRATAVQGTSPDFWTDIQRLARPGTMSDQHGRDKERAGLPGTTPAIDPRLINPENNPMRSLESLMRNDIELSPYVGAHEGYGNAIKYYDQMENYGNPLELYRKFSWEPPALVGSERYKEQNKGKK